MPAAVTADVMTKADDLRHRGLESQAELGKSKPTAHCHPE